MVNTGTISRTQSSYQLNLTLEKYLVVYEALVNYAADLHLDPSLSKVTDAETLANAVASSMIVVNFSTKTNQTSLTIGDVLNLSDGGFVESILTTLTIT
jgi:hypothetical protein